MADVTLMEAAKHSQEEIKRSVTKIIVEHSPILEYLPMKSITGPAYRYHTEGRLGDIAFRGVNGSWTRSVGVINPNLEQLYIMGGELTIDNFEIATMQGLIPLKASKYRMKSRAMGIKFSESFFEGDSAVDPYSFDGIRKRVTGNQKILAAAGGGTLTLAMLDQLLDSVVGDNSQKVLFMNQTLRRKVTALVRATTGSSLITFEQGMFGRQQMSYAGVPIREVYREDDGSTILGFDEDPGDGTSDTASIYCIRFGEEFVHGIQNGAMPDVQDFGQTQAGPYHLGRIEWYVGMAVEHPRSVARLYGITNT